MKAKQETKDLQKKDEQETKDLKNSSKESTKKFRFEIKKTEAKILGIEKNIDAKIEEQFTDLEMRISAVEKTDQKQTKEAVVKKRQRSNHELYQSNAKR